MGIITNLFVPSGRGLIAEILPSVSPHSAGILAGIGWKGRLSPRYFSGGGGCGLIQMTNALLLY